MSFYYPPKYRGFESFEFATVSRPIPRGVLRGHYETRTGQFLQAEYVEPGQHQRMVCSIQMPVYLENTPIGQFTCTFKPSEREGEARLYWMLMGVLPVSFTTVDLTYEYCLTELDKEHRRFGIGGYACQKIMDAVTEHNRRVLNLGAESTNPRESLPVVQAVNDPLGALSKYPITSAFMHVYVLNTGARRLYESYGYTERKRIENFYRRRGADDTAVKDAWFFEKDIVLSKLSKN
jgi:GNAT superfamily N-acetyltransferase